MPELLAPLRDVDRTGLQARAPDLTYKSISMSNAGVVSGPGQGVTLLGADVVNAEAVANTLTDVTGLSFGVISGVRYAFYMHIYFTSAALATGSRWCINGPAMTSLNYKVEWATAATTSQTMHSATLNNAPNVSSGSALDGNTAIMSGIILPSAAGTVIARFASEIASSAITAKAGSYVEWERIT